MSAHGPEHRPLVSMEQARERTIDLLSTHFANDALTLEELERRMELAYRATSMTELAALTSDLEAAAPTAVARTEANAPLAVTLDRDRVVSVMGETQRRGAWAVPQHLDVVAIMSDMLIDLTQASLPTGIIDIHVKALMASVRIILPPGVRIANRMGAFMATVHVRPDEAATRADLPVIRLSGWATMAEVQTKTRHREGDPMARLDSGDDSD
jgi:hypothetical protein